VGEITIRQPHVQIKLRMIIWISNPAGKKMKNGGKKLFL
jgi:hypothetical protein